MQSDKLTTVVAPAATSGGLRVQTGLQAGSEPEKCYPELHLYDGVNWQGRMIYVCPSGTFRNWRYDEVEMW